MTSEEFDEWLEGAPAIDIGVTGEFDGWLEGAPDVDVGGAGTAPPPPPRRRVHVV